MADQPTKIPPFLEPLNSVEHEALCYATQRLVELIKEAAILVSELTEYGGPSDYRETLTDLVGLTDYEVVANGLASIRKDSAWERQNRISKIRSYLERYPLSEWLMEDGPNDSPYEA